MSPGKARRRKEVERLREEGRQAFLAGRHRQTNPYPSVFMNFYQWIRGYDDAEDESKRGSSDEE